MNIDAVVGKRIELARREFSWNQEDLAERMHVNQRSISRWESGAVSVTADNLWRLADLFHKPVSYFFEPLPAGAESKKARRRRDPAKEPAHR